ncbi:GNAT family N-acetyltransferase [Paenibacillus sp. T1]|uniref:GNAT family N-acetyltransferase n=2 Tax=Paenibacillus glycinis TaxID=2697035 RepID=A0ABW9XQI6_9BACL|nr:GNAT family N-acetyltransferase [Paenibacillus glycinis]
MELQAEALYAHDSKGSLLTINEPGGGPAPRMFLGRTIQGTTVCRFRHDVPDDLVRRLEALCAEDGRGDLRSTPRHFDSYMYLLDAQVYTMGPAYLVPVDLADERPVASNPVTVTRQNAELLAGDFDWLIPEVDDAQPCIAAVSDGRAVSVCRSVRIASRAHEAGLETLPEFRGQGYAAAVVAGWAEAVRRADRIPLYSTFWDNHSSRRVAQKLGLACYGTDFVIV